ncbi:hypothetical protein J2Z69_000205 [Paenibacillus shirakamiensis]|uniref:DUF1540 domain-containing protein n=2 Tax=Paenibacillus shirakamiensis TaxID=1265935 RepID=A0ABS4JDK1_9BACL|nr:DUF1540 domain-containing protein [Paenibacillus shirakamiensis]MBP1999186.1 hypothetical protein [Paenibacillus shirakamiensis]
MPNGDKPVVKCSVSNCSFWGENNFCRAEQIMIDIDQHARTRYNAEIAGESFDSEHKDAVATSAATCCHTFKPKSYTS